MAGERTNVGATTTILLLLESQPKHQIDKPSELGLVADELTLQYFTVCARCLKRSVPPIPTNPEACKSYAKWP